MASDPRAKILRLLDVAQELAEKQAAIDAEIRALITGDEGVNAKVKRLFKTFSETWESRYGTPYVPDYKKDTNQWKRLLRLMSVDEIEARVLSFIRSDDKFYLQTSHKFGVFLVSINSLAGRPAPTFAAGCAHQPRCADAAVCTARKHYEVTQ